MSEDNTGFNLAVGTVEEARNLIGETSKRYSSAERINRSMIQFFAGLVEDRNPSFWDEGFARKQWGGIYSPLAMLRVWRLKPLWHPIQDAELGSVTYPTEVPLPAEYNSVINIRTKEKYHRPALVGSRLHWEAELLDVSDKKSTRVGDGHFLTTLTTFRNDDGIKVGEYENVMLRHATGAGSETETESSTDTDGRFQIEKSDIQLTDDAYESVPVETVDEGEELPSYEYPVSYRRVIHNVAATRDFFPGHYDPKYAQSQGNPSIYLNTMTFQGLIDRLALDWAGPAWRVAERTMTMTGSAVAGDLLTVGGTVVDVSPDGPTVEIEVEVYSENNDDVIIPASVTITKDCP